MDTHQNSFLLAGLGLLILLSQPLSGCSDESAPPPRAVAAPSKAIATPSTPQTVKEQLMTMKTPTNMPDLLENLRDVHRSRIALDEAFYTEENIKKITAAEKVRFYKKENELEVGAIDFPAIAGDLGSDANDGISLRISLKTKPDGKKYVLISLSFSRTYPALHYLVIEKLIGQPWQQRMPRPMGSNQIYREPTDYYGNWEMEYSRKDGNVVEEGDFSFNPAGLLNRLFLSTEYVEEHQ